MHRHQISPASMTRRSLLAILGLLLTVGLAGGPAFSVTAAPDLGAPAIESAEQLAAVAVSRSGQRSSTIWRRLTRRLRPTRAATVTRRSPFRRRSLRPAPWTSAFAGRAPPLVI